MKLGPELATDALRLGHQRPADAPFAGTGIDDEREDPDDPVVVLEPRQGVDGDEPEHRPIVLGDDDPGLWGGESLEPRDDVARAGRIALIGEQRGDRLGVGGARRVGAGSCLGRS